MKILKTLPLVLIISMLLACSKSEENESEEHFLSSQQKAMEKAEGVEDMLKETEEKRRKDAEQATN